MYELFMKTFPEDFEEEEEDEVNVVKQVMEEDHNILKELEDEATPDE